MIEVTLTDYEMAMAANAACLRNIAAKKRNYQTVFNDADWQAHVEGACGEVAVAKAFGKYWGGSVNTWKKGGDIDSTGWEVRTRSKHHYDLIIRDDDPDDRTYILVTGISPDFTIRGWITAKEAKQEQYAKDYGGHGMAYFFPQNKLRDMEELI